MSRCTSKVGVAPGVLPRLELMIRRSLEALGDSELRGLKIEAVNVLGDHPGGREVKLAQPVPLLAP